MTTTGLFYELGARKQPTRQLYPVDTRFPRSSSLAALSWRALATCIERFMALRLAAHERLGVPNNASAAWLPAMLIDGVLFV